MKESIRKLLEQQLEYEQSYIPVVKEDIVHAEEKLVNLRSSLESLLGRVADLEEALAE